MRYVILICAIVMQMCLGATYSWSVYVQPLKQLTGLTQGSVQLPFSVFYFAFPATMIFSGTLLPRIGPRISAAAGGILFGSGWLLASFGESHFSLTVAGIGLLAGFGVGFAYIVPIATCIRWFPRNKGLVTGIAVAGFGGGAALVSQVGGYLMQSAGASPFDTFRVLGIAFLLLVTAAGLTMQNPPGTASDKNDSMSIRPLLNQKAFLPLYLAMFAGLAAGFTVNANLKEFFVGVNMQTGITAVSLFAVANALGRICWGIVFDRLRSTVAIRINLVCQAAIFFVAPWLVQRQWGFLIFACLTGFNYGGVLVVYAGSVARIWGGERVGQVYGWLFSANIPAAMAPILAGFGYDLTGSFTISLVVIGMVLISAAALVSLRL